MEIRKWYFYALTISTVFFLIWCWHRLIYQPLQQQEHTKISIIAQLEQKKTQIPDLRYQVDVLRQHNEQVQHTLQAKILNQEHIDPYVSLEHVLLNLDEAGLQLVSLMPQEFKRKSFYEKCIFGFKAIGTYEQIMLLLNHFCEKHPNSIFKKVAITNVDNKLLLETIIALYLVDRDGL